MATYAELREKYVNGQGKEQQTKKRKAPDNAQIVAGARQYLAQHQAENADKWKTWQEAATARDNASAAARAAEEAQKKYDEYLLTDEAQSYVRQNQAAKGAQLMQGAGISTPYAAGMQQQAAPQKDQKAEALKAERDRLKNMMNAENDRYVMESDLAELATWTEEDRSNLDKYVGFRQTGITSGGYAVPAKEAYNNLVAKYGKEKVDQLAYTWQRDKNAKDTKALAERSAAAVKGNTGKAIGHSAATIPANLLGSVAGAYGVALDWATRDNRYSTLDPNNIGTMASVYSGAVRGQVAEDIAGDQYDENGELIKDGGLLRQGLSIGYQGAMSAADSIARAAAGGGGFGTLALAATGSFSQTVSEASKQGATPQQAIILGIGNAALEAATEKVPLDNMLKAAKGGIKGAKAIAKEALRQAAIEATEEEISLFGSLLLEAAVLQGKSAYQQSIAENIANGMSYEEAKEQADKAVWAEALNTAMVSAVAGGLSGGGSAIAGNVFNGRAEVAQKPAEAATQQKETQTQEQPDVAQAVVQGLTQAQETEAQANAAQAQAVANAAQSVAEQFPDRTQTEPKSQQKEQLDNATAAMLAENGVVQPEAEQNVGIKGTGAAEANFSGKAQYQDLLYEGNVQPDREGDVRPMEVPKTDSYGRNVSEFVANAYGAEITPDTMANTIEELVQEGALGFDRRSNQDALNDAAKVIENSTPSAITKRITGNIANGKIKDGDIEQAMLLYSHYANKNGERAQAQAAELMVDLTTMAHMTGRNLQLFKLLRKLTPEGQVMTIKRTVEQNVENMVRSGKAKDGSRPQINDQLLEDYKKAAAENARAVSAEQKAESEAKMQEIQQAIMVDAASQIQTTFKAKWDAWRYMAMLGNGKTQIRNFAGNVFFMPYKAAKDTIGAAFELAVPKDKRTKALGMDKQLLNWAKQDSKTTAVHDALKYTGKLGDDATTAKFADNVKVFDTKALEAVRKFTSDLPAKADFVFKNQYYASSLAGFLKARGYTLQDVQGGKVSDAVMAEARGYAINEAMKATFNDCNSFSDTVSNLRFKDPDATWKKVANMVGESVLPFRKTPANILVRFAEYSPAGMAKGAWDMATKVSSGKISAAAAVDQIASGLTGTSVMMLGYLMAKGIAGVKLTGSGADDDEKRQGHQDYALEFSINGQEYSYTIDWAAPANLPLFVGANLYNAMERNGADTSISALSRIWQVSKGALEPMLKLSCMSSLNDLFETARYAPEGEALYSVAADIATGYFTQGIPAILRQAGQAIPKDKQTTFANDPDPNVRELQKLGAQIPVVVAPKFQTEKRNAWGETETTESELMRAFNSFINPGSIKKIDNSELEKEITRLGKTQEQNVTPPDIPKKLTYTDASGNLHDNYRLTEEQYQKLAQTQGQTAKKILDQMVISSDYKKMTDDQKAYAIKAAYEYAQEQGKKAALPDYHSKAAEWISKTKESDIQAFVTRGATQALNSAISSAVSNLGDGLPVTEATKADMEETYKAFANMSAKTKEQILYEASAETVKYLTARQNGATAKNYLDVVQNVKALGEKPKDAQTYNAVVNTPGMTDAVKDALVKAYMTDYDPDAKSPDKTELKYDYIRQKMEMTPQEYAKIMKTYYEVDDISSDELKENGLKKKNVFISRWIEDGMTQEEAIELYNLLVNTSKNTRIDVVSWYENQ